MEYLTIPFILKDGYLKKVDIHDSIVASVGMLLSTRPGTMPFDPDYGCNIWEREFTDMLTANKSDVRSNFRNAIDKYEKRLYNVSVSFLNLDGKSVGQGLGVAVRVEGNYKEDGQEKDFTASFQLS